MQSIETIPNDTGVQQVTFEPVVGAICPIDKAPILGVAKIVYSPGSKLIEFNSVEGFIRSLATQHLTVEALCSRVYEAIAAVLSQGERLSVEISVKAAGHAPVTVQIERE